MKVYTLKTYIYLDKTIQQYRKIVIINKKPIGYLSSLAVRIQNEKRSIFEVNTLNFNHCLYAIKNPNTNDFFDLDNITDLFEILMENGYIIDKSFNKVMYKNNSLNKDFICLIKLIDEDPI